MSPGLQGEKKKATRQSSRRRHIVHPKDGLPRLPLGDNNIPELEVVISAKRFL